MVAYSGMGMSKIAEYLYDNKVLSPMALREYAKGDYSNPNPYGWHRSSINNLLHNEVYLGKIIYGKTRKVNFKNKKVVKTDKSEWIVVDDAHEPIITQKLWDDTHIRIDARKRKSKGVEENIFRGLLKCDDCGGTMRITSPLNKKKFFVCGNSKKRVGGAELCSTHNIQYDVLYDAVLKDIRSVLEQFNKDEKTFRKYVLDSISEVSCDAEKLSESIAELDV